MSTRLETAVAELVEALRAELAPVADAPDRLLSIDETAATLNLGRSLLYDLIGQGRIRTIVVGRRRLVPASSVAEFIADQAGER